MSENEPKREYCVRILAKGRRVSAKGRRRPGPCWEFEDGLTLHYGDLFRLRGLVIILHSAGIDHTITYEAGTVRLYPNAENYTHPRPESVRRYGSRPEWLLFLLPDAEAAAGFFVAVERDNDTEIHIKPGREVSEDAPQMVITGWPVGR